MFRSKIPFFLLSFLGAVGGSIAGLVLVIAMMMSAARSGKPVGYEGFFYLLASPFVGAAVGVKACHSLNKSGNP